MTVMLTPHFSLAEMCATSRRFPNTPNADQIENLRALCLNIGEPVRSHFRAKYPDRKIVVIVTSGFRSKMVNKAVGGAPYVSPSKPGSQHLRGEAMDFHIPGVANAEVFEYIRDHLLFDQVIAEKLRKDNGAAGWIHVSFAMRCRKQALSFLGNRYVPGLQFME